MGSSGSRELLVEAIRALLQPRDIRRAPPNTAGYPLALRMVLRVQRRAALPVGRDVAGTSARRHRDRPASRRPGRARQGALFAAATVTNSLAFPTVEPARLCETDQGTRREAPARWPRTSLPCTTCSRCCAPPRAGSSSTGCSRRLRALI